MLSNRATASTNLPRAQRRQQRGLAAVEFAIILPVMIALLAFPLFFGRMFMHYSVAQKAAHDAALFLSTMPVADMIDPDRSLGAAAIARQITQVELAELRPGGIYPITVDVYCDGSTCGMETPTRVRVLVRMRMNDEFFKFLTYPFVGDRGFLISADVDMLYIGT